MVTTTLFILMNNVMMAIITIISAALMTCAMMYKNSPWTSYMLFLIFVGGMMIMLTYTASLSLNINMKTNKMLTTTTLMALLMLFTQKKMVYMNNSIYMTYSSPSWLSLMILYLFITMFIVMSMTTKNKGPMRKMHYVKNTND